jgi:hypothetical protein
MPEITPCPKCGRKIRVADELLGKKIRCPRCGVTFVVEAPEQQLEEAIAERPGRSSRGRLDEEEEPRARRRDDDEDDEGPRPARRRPPPASAGSWERVRRGIGLMLIAIAIAIVGWIAVFVTTLLAMALTAGVALSSMSGKDMNALNAAIGTSVVAMIVIAGVAILFGISYVVVRFIAHLDSTAAPAREGAHALGVWGFWMYVGWLVLPVLYFLLMIVCGGMLMGAHTQAAVGMSATLMTIASVLFYIVWVGVLTVGGWFVWLFFLRACAKLVRAPRLAQSILFLILTAALLLVSGLAMGGLNLLAASAVTGAELTTPSGPGLHPAAGPSAASGLAGVLGVVQLGCGCLTLFLALATFVWTIVSMFLVRSAITRYLEGRA